MNKLFKKLRKLTRKPVDSVAVVLSGGGSRGAIEVGVLQALDENDIKVEAISGTSIGAIIGALYSAGISPLQMQEIMARQTLTKIFHFSWSKKGLLSMNELLKIFKKYNVQNSFDLLNIPFYACASNLDTEKGDIFSSGDLFQSVIASASIPLLFEPVVINNQHYIDGGLYNNFPIGPLLDKYPYILGVHVNNYKEPEDYNALAIAERVFTAVVQQNIVAKLKKCDYLIDPFLENHGSIIDFRQTNKLFEIGYNEGIKFVKSALKKSSTSTTSRTA